MTRRFETREEFAAAFRDCLIETAYSVRYTEALIARKDPDQAEEFGARCASIISNSLRPGVGWAGMIAALDTIEGLCLIEQAKAGPIQ